jgi:hypothetical protein
MLTKEQYDSIIQHREHIKNTAEGGSPPRLPLELYNEIRKVTMHDFRNKDVDWYCNGCKTELIVDMWRLIQNYEDGSSKG